MFYTVYDITKSISPYQYLLLSKIQSGIILILLAILLIYIQKYLKKRIFTYFWFQLILLLFGVWVIGTHAKDTFTFFAKKRFFIKSIELGKEKVVEGHFRVLFPKDSENEIVFVGIKRFRFNRKLTPAYCNWSDLRGSFIKRSYVKIHYVDDSITKIELWNRRGYGKKNNEFYAKKAVLEYFLNKNKNDRNTYGFAIDDYKHGYRLVKELEDKYPKIVFDINVLVNGNDFLNQYPNDLKKELLVFVINNVKVIDDKAYIGVSEWFGPQGAEHYNCKLSKINFKWKVMKVKLDGIS